MNPGQPNRSARHPVPHALAPARLRDPPQKDARAALEEDAARLSDWADRLHALTRDFDAARAELRAAREEIEAQRGGLAADAAALAAARADSEGQRAAVAHARVALDRWVSPLLIRGGPRERPWFALRAASWLVL